MTTNTGETANHTKYAKAEREQVGRVTPCAPFSRSSCGAHGVMRPTWNWFGILLMLAISVLSRASAQGQCGYGITPQVASGSATRDKVGVVCGSCPPKYYLASNSGSGWELSAVSFYHTEWYDPFPEESEWTDSNDHIESVNGSRTQIDPERTSTGAESV